jgi:hypothetical protein
VTGTAADFDLHHRLWLSVPSRRRAWMAVNIAAVISGGLALDILLGWTGQRLATLWTLAVFAWLYRIGSAEDRRVLILCTLISGTGEVFLSLVWGLYDYQFHNVPLFVPPGHALLMTLGLLVARQVPRAGVLLVSIAAIGWAAHAWNGNFDRFGALLATLYFICVLLGRAKSLYATMFALALIMELYGTALGNWAWQAQAPWLHVSMANPPFSAGAFYCALDLLVLGAMKAWPVVDRPKHQAAI